MPFREHTEIFAGLVNNTYCGFCLCVCVCRCVVWTGNERVFFYNPTTRLSMWERPTELIGRADVDRSLQDPPHKSTPSLEPPKPGQNTHTHTHAHTHTHTPYIHTHTHLTYTHTHTPYTYTHTHPLHTHTHTPLTYTHTHLIKLPRNSSDVSVNLIKLRP